MIRGEIIICNQLYSVVNDANSHPFLHHLLGNHQLTKDNG